jgi:hypothetical protein
MRQNFDNSGNCLLELLWRFGFYSNNFHNAPGQERHRHSFVIKPDTREDSDLQ